MAQENVGFDMFCPQAVDRSYGALSAGQNVPYSSTAAAVAAINAAYRYIGKTVVIAVGGLNVEYWWRVGTADANLIQKINGEQVWDFVVGFNNGDPNFSYQPADKATILTAPFLVNCVILGFGGDQGGISTVPRAGFQSFSYSPGNGQITMVNTKFAQSSWYSIKFRQL